MTTDSPAVLAAQRHANENDRLLSVVLRLALRLHRDGWYCAECGAVGPVRLMIRHAPGCVLWNIPSTTLAAIDAFELREGEAI